MYEKGAMGAPDISQAMLWYNKGIAGGSHFAEYYLARCYDTDEILPDYQKALNYYNKASEAGVSEASYYLADMFLDGRAGSKRKKDAFNLFKKVSERWIEIRNTPTAHVVITVDENGIHVTEEKQKEMSKEIYPLSMLRLGECYLNGIGTERNESEGTKWIAIANKLGYK
jgi:TPR repeat protein